MGCFIGTLFYGYLDLLEVLRTEIGGRPDLDLKPGQILPPIAGSGIGQPPSLDWPILPSIAGSGNVQCPLLDRPILPSIAGSGSVQPTLLEQPILPPIASSGSVQPPLLDWPFAGAAPIGEPMLHSPVGLPNPFAVASRPIPHGINWPAILPDPMLVEPARMLDPVLVERELAHLRKREEIALRGMAQERMLEEAMQRQAMQRDAKIKKREEAQQLKVERDSPLPPGNIGDPMVSFQFGSMPDIVRCLPQTGTSNGRDRYMSGTLRKGQKVEGLSISSLCWSSLDGVHRCPGTTARQNLAGTKRKAEVGDLASSPQLLPDKQPLLSKKPWCDVCKVPCSSMKSFQQHLHGWKHKAKLKELGVTEVHSPAEILGPELLCGKCNISCLGMTAMELHLVRKKHALCVKEIEGAKNASAEKLAEAPGEVKGEELKAKGKMAAEKEVVCGVGESLVVNNEQASRKARFVDGKEETPSGGKSPGVLKAPIGSMTPNEKKEVAHSGPKSCEAIKARAGEESYSVKNEEVHGAVKGSDAKIEEANSGASSSDAKKEDVHRGVGSPEEEEEEEEEDDDDDDDDEDGEEDDDDDGDSDDDDDEEGDDDDNDDDHEEEEEDSEEEESESD